MWKVREKFRAHFSPKSFTSLRKCRCRRLQLPNDNGLFKKVKAEDKKIVRYTFQRMQKCIYLKNCTAKNETWHEFIAKINLTAKCTSPLLDVLGQRDEDDTLDVGTVTHGEERWTVFTELRHLLRSFRRQVLRVEADEAVRRLLRLRPPVDH